MHQHRCQYLLFIYVLMIIHGPCIMHDIIYMMLMHAPILNCFKKDFEVSKKHHTITAPILNINLSI